MTPLALIVKSLLKHDLIRFLFLWVVALTALLRLSPRNPDILTVFVDVVTIPAEKSVFVRMPFMGEFDRSFSILFIRWVIQQDQIEISWAFFCYSITG